MNNHQKRSWGIRIILSSALAFSCLAGTAQAAEDWKGKSNPYGITLGGMAGIADIESNVGFSVLGTASKSLLDRGFIPDVNDTVDLEAAVGPVFGAGNTGIMYSVHLRWSFIKDDLWSFYALGGLGGSVRKSDAVDSTRFLLFPRVGLGTMMKVNDVLSIRGEFSHEFVGVGVTFFFL